MTVRETGQALRPAGGEHDADAATEASPVAAPSPVLKASPRSPLLSWIALSVRSICVSPTSTLSCCVRESVEQSIEESGRVIGPLAACTGDPDIDIAPGPVFDLNPTRVSTLPVVDGQVEKPTGRCRGLTKT